MLRKLYVCQRITTIKVVNGVDIKIPIIKIFVYQNFAIIFANFCKCCKSIAFSLGLLRQSHFLAGKPIFTGQINNICQFTVFEQLFLILVCWNEGQRLNFIEEKRSLPPPLHQWLEKNIFLFSSHSNNHSINHLVTSLPSNHSYI